LLPAPPARLIEHYKTKVVPALQQKFGYKNLMAVPRVEKIVVSMGLGKFATSGGDGKANFEKAIDARNQEHGPRNYDPTRFTDAP
jgi:ribosomal protein L5